MSLKISQRTEQMPASAIRKLVPLADAAKAEGVKVYHLNVGAPDIKSPDCAINAVVEKCKTMHHLSYTHSAGFMELRKGLVEKYYKKIGIDIDVNEIIIEVAGSEAFASAMQIACDPGDEIIVVEPYYTNYQTFAYLNGITLKAVPTDIRNGFDVDDISAFEALVTPKTKAVLLSNPCNPSGKLFTKKEMLAIGEFCIKHNLFLISDEVYREFCYTDEPHFSAMNIPGCEQNVILVDSVSKRYNLCGARIGCIISHNKDVMAAAMKFAQSRLCPPVFGQYAAIGALDTPQSYFDEVKEEYIRRRDCAVEMLNEIPGVYAPTPYGAFYTVVELPVDDAEDFARWMLSEFRVDGETTMVTPAASFYKTPGVGRNHVRVAYVLEVPELKKAINILAQGLAAYQNKTV
ncbi:MAG: pyridoxal phosphate-dependent aminotransferase [Bacteroidales bacterium]|nr:pyridoxal phosphate-dependent aminotransferase [Bacteroidales bacterium]MBQ5582099.1 pyridoxal phosphate-dependent aminotransferase [Bacteroidales bacterium]MBQ5639289.1 pyridoxal phosphate-dependent aminotransferase [Bacteroidales bacterium]